MCLTRKRLACKAVEERGKYGRFMASWGSNLQLTLGSQQQAPACWLGSQHLGSLMCSPAPRLGRDTLHFHPVADLIAKKEQLKMLSLAGSPPHPQPSQQHGDCCFGPVSCISFFFPGTLISSLIGRGGNEGESPLAALQRRGSIPWSAAARGGGSSVPP